MNILTTAIIAFLVMEAANVITLYFFPGSKRGNGIGVFTAFEKSKQDPEIHSLVKYLINWVAGTKLIFILLLLIIAFMGDENLQLFAAGAMVLSIASFFWRLFPGIRKMDKNGWITPKGYSKGLGLMITGMILLFSVVLVLKLTVLA